MRGLSLSTSEADWRLVRAFVAVMQAGTLTGAARLLGTTQPTVGRQIRELEQLAGETYFLRRGSRLEPTEHAQLLFARALDVERAVTALARSLAEPLTTHAKVRLTTSEIFGTQLLPSLIPSLMARVPGVEIEVTATDRVQDLHRRDADLAIRFVAPTQPDLIAWQVGEVTIGLYATPSYLDRHSRPKTPQDLLTHNLISSLDGREIKAAAKQLGLSSSPNRMPLRSDSLLVREGFVRAGLGIGACHNWLATAVPGLERVLAELDVVRLPVWLVAHEDLRRSRSMKLLYDALGDELAARFGSTK